MKKAIITTMAALATTALSAQESQTAYNFLRLPVSAHAAAVGGDNVTIVEDDAALMFSNPALLSSVSDKTIGLNVMTYMAGATTASATFNRTVGERASWAVSGQYMNYGKMRHTDANNNQLGEFSASDIAVAGYFSYMLNDRFAGGITAKFLTSHIGDYNSIGAGIDLGLNYYDPNHDWSLSVVAKNLGGQLKAYNEDYEKMPIDLQVGVTKGFENMPFRVSGTLVNLNHWDKGLKNHLVVGAELLLGDNLWLGGGYNARRADEMQISNGTEGEESSHGAGFSFGGGINLERFHINVAYGKYHVSSSSLLINVNYKL